MNITKNMKAHLNSTSRLSVIFLSTAYASPFSSYATIIRLVAALGTSRCFQLVPRGVVGTLVLRLVH